MHFDSCYQVPLVNSNQFYVGRSHFEDNSFFIATSNRDSTKLQHYNSHGLIKQYDYYTSSFEKGVKAIDNY